MWEVLNPWMRFFQKIKKDKLIWFGLCFKSLDEIFPKDKKGNVIRAEKYSEIDSEGNIIINKEKGKIIATIGIEDIVIVNTEDALLVCHKDKSQEIKKILNKIEKENK